jgi:hypothetical protein
MTDDFDEELQAARNQPGGCQQIDFREIRLIAPMNDVKKALATISEADQDYRDMVKASVNEELNLAYDRILSGEASHDEAMRYGQDVAIWFAFKVFEGRAKLADTVVN